MKAVIQLEPLAPPTPALLAPAPLAPLLPALPEALAEPLPPEPTSPEPPFVFPGAEPPPPPAWPLAPAADTLLAPPPSSDRSVAAGLPLQAMETKVAKASGERAFRIALRLQSDNHHRNRELSIASLEAAQTVYRSMHSRHQELKRCCLRRAPF